MKRKRHTPEEIIKKLRAAEEALAGGKTVEDVCRIISVSMATYQSVGRASIPASRRTP
jgi:transposase-like protein